MFKFYASRSIGVKCFDKDDGSNGSGGAGQPNGGQPSATEPGSDPTKTDGGTNNAGADSLKDVLSTNPKLQSEVDSLVGKAVRTARANAQAEHEAAIKAAVEEALADEKLSAAEKKRKEDEKAARVLAEREAKVAESERKLLVSDTLVALKAPVALRDYITATDEDGIKTQISGILAIIDERVNEIKQGLLTQSVSVPPVVQPGSPEAGITAEYNALMAKPNLSTVEQRRLSELAVKIKAMKSGK